LIAEYAEKAQEAIGEAARKRENKLDRAFVSYGEAKELYDICDFSTVA
jgi:hypothetical protein